MLKSVMLTATAILACVSAATAQTPEPLGIPACDEFLTKYEGCIAKMPAANQPTFKSTLDQMRTGWTGMAANAQARPALEGVCKQMSDSMKVAMTQSGCQW
jgi:hypothetical protein